MDVLLCSDDMLGSARSFATWLAAHAGAVATLKLSLADGMYIDDPSAPGGVRRTASLDNGQVMQLFQTLAPGFAAACAGGALHALQLTLRIDALRDLRAPPLILPASWVPALQRLHVLQLVCEDQALGVDAPLAPLVQLAALDLFCDYSSGLYPTATLPDSLTALSLNFFSLPQQVRCGAGCAHHSNMRVCARGCGDGGTAALRAARASGMRHPSARSWCR